MARKEGDVPSDAEVAAGAASNVTQYLKGITFPATRDDVEAQAKRSGAGSALTTRDPDVPQTRPANVAGSAFTTRDQDVPQTGPVNVADESALEEIRYLPGDKKFEDPGQLIKAIGDEIRRL
jgi:hypothetical protein